MIDWITAVLPCKHVEHVHGGTVVSSDEHGVVQYQVRKRRSIVGSAESAVALRTFRGDLQCLEVSGNLVKFFQGHNLWGTDDLIGLVSDFMCSIVQSHGADLGLCPTDSDRAAWCNGDFYLTRVDCTGSFRLSRRADVLAWLRAAEQTAHLSHRGRGQLVKGSTLMFGRHSRRESLKLYAKGQEIEANFKHQPALASAPEAVQWADGILRAELTLRSMSLKRRCLSFGRDWDLKDGVSFNAPGLLRETLGSLTMTTRSRVDADFLDSLRASERTAVVAWEAGADLRGILSRPTFYRLRAKLLPQGIDIATVLPKEKSNVVPLVRFLEAVPAEIPQWARGTSLYFEPLRRKAS